MPNSHYISLPSAVARGRLGITEASYSTLRQYAMSTVRQLNITTKRECPPATWEQYEASIRTHPLLSGVTEIVRDIVDGEDENAVVRIDDGLKKMAEEADGEGAVNGMEKDEEGRRRWGGDEGKVTRKEAREAFLWLLVRSLNSVQGRERERKKKEEDGAVAADAAAAAATIVMMGGDKEDKKGKKKKEKRRFSQVNDSTTTPPDQSIPIASYDSSSTAPPSTAAATSSSVASSHTTSPASIASIIHPVFVDDHPLRKKRSTNTINIHTLTNPAPSAPSLSTLPTTPATASTTQSTPGPPTPSEQEPPVHSWCADTPLGAQEKVVVLMHGKRVNVYGSAAAGEGSGALGTNGADDRAAEEVARRFYKAHTGPTTAMAVETRAAQGAR